MREIEPEATKGVSEWQGGQRLDESRLISCIRTCLQYKMGMFQFKCIAFSRYSYSDKAEVELRIVYS